MAAVGDSSGRLFCAAWSDKDSENSSDWSGKLDPNRNEPTDAPESTPFPEEERVETIGIPLPAGESEDADFELTRNQTMRMVVAVEGGAGLAALALGWLIGVWPLSFLEWNAPDALFGLVGTFPLLALFGVVYAARRTSFIRPVDDVLRQYLYPLLRPCTTGDLLWIAFLAGLGEELLFRGVLQPFFASWIGEIGGLLLASLFFGLAHAVTKAYVVITFIAGLFLGWMFLYSGNLLPAMIAHGLYDAVALIYVVKIKQCR